MKRWHADLDNKAVAVSAKLFHRMLAAYPREHRHQYGPPMAQLFRDQCRDAWGRSRRWGLVALWLRVLPDLVKTSVLEHISLLNESKTMLDRISTLLRTRSAPRSVFIAVFTVVFLLVVATSTLITLIMPESYSSTARVLARQNLGEVTRMPGMPVPANGYDPYFIKTQFEVIQSEAVLGKVITSLDLNQAWGKKYAGGIPSLLKRSRSSREEWTSAPCAIPA